jgi:pyruvate kinase
MSETLRETESFCSIKPKTKILWSLSERSFDKQSPAQLASAICDLQVDALRFVVTPSVLPNLQRVRDEITMSFRSKSKCPNPSGQIPFVCDLVGRRARLRIPGGKTEVDAGGQLTLTIRTDFDASVHPTGSPEPTGLELVVSSQDMLAKLEVGTILTVSFGQTVLEIKQLERSASALQATVVAQQATSLLSGMEVQSNAMSTSLLPLLPQDEEVIAHRFMQVADYVIVHGIKGKEELLQLKSRIMPEKSGQGSVRHPSISVGPAVRDSKATLPPRWIWKVDSKESLEMLTDVLECVDGVLISRSELGLSIPANSLPIVQKELIATCNHSAKIVIVASELMYSMRINPNPTRAEVSDMANAAADGADAILLAEEVTEGPFGPLVAQMSRETLVNAAPFLESNWNRVEFQSKTDEEAIAYGALKVARDVGARAIVCLTEGGYTAYRLASLRTPIDIIAISYNENIMRQLNLVNAVQGMTIESSLPFDEILADTKQKLSHSFGFVKGDKIVFVSLTASSISERNSNIFTVQEID